MSRALLVIVCLVLWFLPLIIATLYKLPHQGRIAVLSIALGWTGIAWLAALIIVVGGAIRATEPPAPGSRTWPDHLGAARSQATQDTLSPGSIRSPDRSASADSTGSAGPSEGPEQPSFPRARSPWPGSQG